MHHTLLPHHSVGGFLDPLAQAPRQMGPDHFARPPTFSGTWGASALALPSYPQSASGLLTDHLRRMVYSATLSRSWWLSFGLWDWRGRSEALCNLRDNVPINGAHLNLAEFRGTGSLDVLFCMNSSPDHGLALPAGQDVHEEVRLRRAVGLYALYRLYNGIRHGQFSPQDFHGAFGRFVREGFK